MNKLHTLKNLRLRRQELRRNSMSEEHLLWAQVRSKKLGYKFYRQFSIGPYIVDFYCPAAKLIIELDGAQHLEQENKKYDSERTAFFENLGFRVIRFWNREIQENNALVNYTLNAFLPGNVAFAPRASSIRSN